MKRKDCIQFSDILDIYENPNYIRIHDLNIPLTEDSTKTNDATVTLENINENTTEILQDSIIQFDEVYTHNFKTSMDITSETSYQLTIERTDGRAITATATTPRIADTDVEPTGENCVTTITTIKLIFKPVIDRHHLEASIGFDYHGERY